MKDNVDIEIESFVHGSMCISYSGRCLLSNYMTGNRDANRGQCSQSCRWKYSLVESTDLVNIIQLKKMNMAHISLTLKTCA